MSKDEEMHIDGFGSFLVRIEDVTSRILEGITDDMSEDDRNNVQAAQGALVNEMNTNDTNGYEYEVKSFTTVTSTTCSYTTRTEM